MSNNSNRYKGTIMKIFSLRPTRIFLIFTSLVFFMNSTPIRAEDNEAADHQALKKLFTDATIVFNNHDFKTFFGYFAKEFVFIGIDQSVITNQTELQAHLDRLFTGPKAPLLDSKTEPTYLRPAVFLDKNSAFSYGTTLETYKLKNGEEARIKSYWTAALVKQNGEWKIATLHLGANVLDNSILHKAVTAGKTTAVIAFFVGLILGAGILHKVYRSKNHK